MSLLLLQVEGEPRVQAVRLDDPSHGYAEQYAYRLANYFDTGCRLRWCELDVTSVAEYGPNDVADMLMGAEEFGVTDLPQVWEVITCGAGVGS